MSKVVQIIAGRSVPYSLNNVNAVEFDDGEFYEVPDHVANGMIARKWARLATDDDIAKIADGGGGGQPGQDDPNPKPPPVQEPGKEPPPKPQPENGDDDDGDHDHDGRQDARQALRTKGKRR